MSLAKEISELLSTTPGSYDPDEEDAPKVVERDPEDPEDEVETSNYRRRNVDLLEDVDVKYAGKKSSRRGLTQRDSDDDDDENVSNENDEVTSSDDDTDGSAESEAGSDDSREPSPSTRGEEEEDNIVHVRDSNTSNEAKKGACVRNQLGIWENLLEIRIQLQKCLLTANGMPRAATFNDIKTQSGEAFTGKVAETRKNVAGVFDKLLHLQELLLKQYPETKAGDDDDEEIPSDSDGGEAEPQEEEEGPEKPRKRRKLAHYEKTIALNHEKYRAYRNSVIQKWHDKTRIGMATAKSGTAHSVLEQIEYHLAETKEKLRRRTQVKRSEYEIVGKVQVDDEEYDPEVFDDGDFYHQLLRELIEVKSADVTDPVKLGQQWIRLQGLRSKMKRKIDTRATKGRKVRYAVHAKLVNFMAPVDEGGASWTDEAAKTELFGSLFGKSQSALHVV